MLGVFAIIGTGLVAYTFDKTKARIIQNERQALLDSLHAIVKQDQLNNDIFNDTVEVHSPSLLGTSDPVMVYRARFDGKPVAAVINLTAPDGYSGAIKLLVGIWYDGRIAGVRVVKHQETPGLGDAIEETRSDWVLSFDGHSLDDPLPTQWKVKRDGGVFDQFTGATITPRAIVKAVRKALIYYRDNRALIFPETENSGMEK